jgi:LVIVD repeat-containing protein
MTDRRVPYVCAAALALALATLPAGLAGAHSVDCDTVKPSALVGWPADWAEQDTGCNNGYAPPTSGGPATSPMTTSMTAPPVAANRHTPGRLRQVGHESLKGRGMNSAIALNGDYVYVGSRTDGGHAGQPQGGIMVVDVSRPSRPRLVGGPFDPKPGESSRELRVWRSQDVLIVLNTNCGVGPTLHHCTIPSISNIRFYDISGRNAKQPKLLNEFKVDTHEFFLWEDPKDPDRALIFAGNAAATCGTRGGAPSCPFSVWDISDVPDGGAPVTLFTGLHGFTQVPATGEPVEKPTGGLHSLTISNDGSRAFFALLTGGFAMVDTSDFARGVPNPKPRPLTINEDRPTWPGPGAHSAIKLWNKDWAWVSDEVYGTATAPDHGCPWGWGRIVDISNPQAPTVRAEYREPENDPATCATWNPARTSYSAHNPTLTPHIAFSTWHSGGLEAVDLTHPRAPQELAEFTPEPLDSVLLEDPRLSSDPDTGRNEKVVMWSYPIIQDGLIYAIDLRNGLYVLKYSGPHDDEVRHIEFLEGNSNQGDALCFEPVGRAPRRCR